MQNISLYEVSMYEIHPKLEQREVTLRRKIQVVVENQELTISSFQAPGLRKEEDKLG